MTAEYNKYLLETPMLNYSHPEIRLLVLERGWENLDEFSRIKSIYNFVRDEIPFGYNIDDGIPASKVLKDGYGQCNTKSTSFYGASSAAAAFPAAFTALPSISACKRAP